MNQWTKCEQTIFSGSFGAGGMKGDEAKIQWYDKQVFPCTAFKLGMSHAYA